MSITLQELLARVKEASHRLSMTTGKEVNAAIKGVADALLQRREELLAANAKDLEALDEQSALRDRLLLTEERLMQIARDMKAVSALHTPLGRTLEQRVLQNGLHLRKVTVPLGVVGMIYESRPNVTFDAFAICMKSGNACVLKGGSEAQHTNEAAVNIIRDVLVKKGIDPHCVELLPPDRAAVEGLLRSPEYIDVIIPRGSAALIAHVREQSRVPIIETGAGIVHIYVDRSADSVKAARIIDNAKTVRPTVCNALDCLIIHRAKLPELPSMLRELETKGVELFADEDSYAALSGHYDPSFLKKANPESFGTEFLALKMAVKTVDGLEDALEHIAKYSSKHSEAVLAEDPDVIDAFLTRVDSAAVYANASTYFTDGAQFGLGAEIGISTQKLHARGPMGLREMTTYKWVVRGDGQIRE